MLDRTQQRIVGVLVEKANRASILNNLVEGPDEGPLGLRGDGIRLWETRDSEVRGNRVIGSRDMVIWYSSNNRLIDNTVVRSRYGTHFMYSHDNVVRGNRYIDNVVGIFIMYSRNLELRENLLARSSGPGGMGLGIKESGNLTVSDNAFIANTKGVYMDTTPLEPADFNTFENNAFFHLTYTLLGNLWMKDGSGMHAPWNGAYGNPAPDVHRFLRFPVLDQFRADE